MWVLDRIYNTVFSYYLTNGPNKLKCLCPTSLSSLLFCNTLAYWTLEMTKDRGRIFSREQPFYERAVSDLDP
jgi:hypothetical protein